MLAATAVLGLLLSTTACGIPDDGPVVPLGLPQFDPANAYSSGPDPSPSLTSAADSVSSFLAAAAGDSGKRQSRLERFLAGSKKEPRWAELDTLPLIEFDKPELVQGGRVRVVGTIVAVYTADGQILPPETETSVDVDYELTQDPDSLEWLFTDPPGEVMLDVRHFRLNYVSAPIYFLNKLDHRTVVPDPRYVYLGIGDRSATLLSWLLAGPSQAMKPFVYTAIPPNTKLNSAANTDGTVVVDFDSGAANMDPMVAAPQIAWTLRTMRDVTRFDLQVDSISRVARSLAEFRSNNLASRTDGRDVHAHVIADGAVEPPVPGVAPTTYGDGLRYVVPHLASGRTIIVNGDGVRVIMPAYEGQNPKNAGPAAITVTGLKGGEIGRPTWLGEGTILIPIGGKVYAAVLGDTGKVAVKPTPIMSATVGRISASPDGTRLAYTSADRAHWVAVQNSGDGNLAVGSPHDIGPSVTHARDVGWSREDRVIVTGIDDKKRHLLEFSLDNLFTESVSDIGSASELDELAVRPSDPWDPSGRSNDLYVMLEDTVYEGDSRLSEYKPDGTVLKGRGVFLQ